MTPITAYKVVVHRYPQPVCYRSICSVWDLHPVTKKTCVLFYQLHKKTTPNCGPIFAFSDWIYAENFFTAMVRGNYPGIKWAMLKGFGEPSKICRKCAPTWNGEKPLNWKTWWRLSWKTRKETGMIGATILGTTFLRSFTPTEVIC